MMSIVSVHIDKIGLINVDEQGFFAAIWNVGGFPFMLGFYWLY